MTVPGPTGAVYLLDKGRGTSSRKAAGEVARAFGYRKYGHAGTLDPDATGVLVVLLGRATRLSRFLTGHDKRYTFVLRLGVVTDTDDGTGRVIGGSGDSAVTRGTVERLLADSYTGRMMQRVPRFSAVRVDGTRAFRAARRGQELADLPVRAVTAVEWSAGEMDGQSIPLGVTVSAGTYVRALARDIGEELGTGAIADDIRRISSGWFGIDDCSTGPGDERALLSMSRAMSGYPSMELEAGAVSRVLHGGAVDGDAEGTVCLLDGHGSLVAVGTGDAGTVRPLCVLEDAG